MKVLIIGCKLFGLLGCKKKKTEIHTLPDNRASVLIETIKNHPDCLIYEITNSEPENLLDWSIEPTKLRLIPSDENHYLVKAQIIDSIGFIETGFINVSTPERISDYVLHNMNQPSFDPIYKCTDKDVIPAVASECFGSYELYYSKRLPNTGLKILKDGLTLSSNNNVIAEDIAYILRDEGRLEEALEYFIMSAENGLSSQYIYGEIEDIYRNQGNDQMADEYKLKFEQY